MNVTEEQMITIYSIAFEHEGCIGGSKPKFLQEEDLVIMEEKFTYYSMESGRSFYPEEYNVRIYRIKPDGDYVTESIHAPMEKEIQNKWEAAHKKSEKIRKKSPKLLGITYDAEGNEDHEFSDGKGFKFMISDEQKKQRKKMCQDMMEAAKKDADLDKSEAAGSGAKA